MILLINAQTKKKERKKQSKKICRFRYQLLVCASLNTGPPFENVKFKNIYF